MGAGFRQSYITYDPLEARLDAVENKRATYLPAVWEASNAVPVMGALGRELPAAATWRMTMSPPSPSPPTSPINHRTSYFMGGHDKPSLRPVSTSSGNRWSFMMEKLVDRTGKVRRRLQADRREWRKATPTATAGI